MRCHWLKIALMAILLTFSLGVKPNELFSNTCKKHCRDTDLILNAATMASEATGLDLALILAVMSVESTFIPKAKNGRSVGLMQVNLDYHLSKFKGKNPYGIYDNVFIGSGILKDCMVKNKNNVNLALRCYNGSPKSNVYPTKVFAALKIVRSQLA